VLLDLSANSVLESSEECELGQLGQLVSPAARWVAHLEAGKVLTAPAFPVKAKPPRSALASTMSWFIVDAHTICSTRKWSIIKCTYL
jgi:hypothetical protein